MYACMRVYCLCVCACCLCVVRGVGVDVELILVANKSCIYVSCVVSRLSSFWLQVRTMTLHRDKQRSKMATQVSWLLLPLSLKTLSLLRSTVVPIRLLKIIRPLRTIVSVSLLKTTVLVNLIKTTVNLLKTVSLPKTTVSVSLLKITVQVPFSLLRSISLLRTTVSVSLLRLVNLQPSSRQARMQYICSSSSSSSTGRGHLRSPARPV